MKIGIIASIWISNPPKGFGFGAQEYLTYYLAEKLTEKGHKVTLFASGDSITKANLVHITDKQVIDIDFPDTKIKDVFELMNVSEAYKHAGDFDIIHNHLLPYGLLFADSSKTPTVHTLHHLIYRNRADIFLYNRYKNQNYISISKTLQKVIPELNYINTVYNGIDLSFYTYKEIPDDSYLLYIGRIKRYKGIHTAIQLAKKLGIKLKIAGPPPLISQPDFKEVNDYWEKDIKPFFDNDIEYMGAVDGDNKISLLQNAKAILFPVEREEPFGMTLIEAMSCGTPVITYAKGSTPEIVKDGKTGFIVNFSDEDKRGNWTIRKTNIDGLTEAIKKIYNMNKEEYAQMRKESRAHVEHNFSINTMVDNYEKVYQQILAANP